MNEGGGFESFDVGGGHGNASIYYNLGQDYEQYVLQLQSDSRGVESVYPESYFIGAAGANTAIKGVGAYTGAVAGRHTAHHAFPVIGKYPHLQLNFWVKGVSSSGRAFRVPIPQRYTQSKDIYKLLW